MNKYNSSGRTRIPSLANSAQLESLTTMQSFIFYLGLLSPSHSKFLTTGETTTGKVSVAFCRQLQRREPSQPHNHRHPPAGGTARPGLLAPHPRRPTPSTLRGSGRGSPGGEGGGKKGRKGGRHPGPGAPEAVSGGGQHPEQLGAAGRAPPAVRALAPTGYRPPPPPAARSPPTTASPPHPALRGAVRARRRPRPSASPPPAGPPPLPFPSRLPALTAPHIPAGRGPAAAARGQRGGEGGGGGRSGRWEGPVPARSTAMRGEEKGMGTGTGSGARRATAAGGEGRRRPGPDRPLRAGSGSARRKGRGPAQSEAEAGAPPTSGHVPCPLHGCRR